MKPVAVSDFVINSGGSLVAYVVGFLSGGNLNVYIPSVGKYATINPTTGSYVRSGTIYYANAGCTGSSAVGNGWTGEVGKTVLFDGTNYYLVSTVYSGGQSFSMQSYTVGSSCTNSSGTYTTLSTDGQLMPTSQPYNFAAIAPLTITYP